MARRRQHLVVVVEADPHDLTLRPLLSQLEQGLPTTQGQYPCSNTLTALYHPPLIAHWWCLLPDKVVRALEIDDRWWQP